MAQTSVDVDALYAAIEHRRRDEAISWRDLARQLQLSPSSFTRMAQGKRPDVDAFATLLRWLGEPVEKFIRPLDDDAELDDESLAAVSLFFRGERNVRAEDIQAYEDIFRVADKALGE